MRILHICNDFCGSKVHANLYKRLDELNVEQTIFTYYRGTGKEEKNQFEALHTSFIYKGILRIWHRLFYHLKIRKVYSELKKEIIPLDYDLIHATTLFSDGAIAYQLHKEFNLPYIVTVRNTDVNTFLGIAPHTWLMGLKILRNAQRIIFISKALQGKFCKHIAIRRILPDIQNKFVLQPNGIDDYWLNNINRIERTISYNVIYVGRFDRNKNVVRLIKAVLNLRQLFPDLRLHLVGGGGSKEREVLRMIDNHPDCLFYQGQISDKDKLKELYRQCSIFAMPSIHETFGLVYIEALSQNLAILYTRGQGVDGMFDRSVGEAVNPQSIKSIENGLKKYFEQPSAYHPYNIIDFDEFRWEKIAGRYKKIYEKALVNRLNPSNEIC